MGPQLRLFHGRAPLHMLNMVVRSPAGSTFSTQIFDLERRSESAAFVSHSTIGNVP